MKIAVLDDYQDVFRTIPAYERLADHEVVVFRDTEKNVAKLAERLKEADVVVLTQQRSAFPRALVEQLPMLQLIAQTGSHQDHFDIVACTERGVAIAAKGGGIESSRRTLRATSQDDLTELVAGRLESLLAQGVTTVEAKSGYGLDWNEERKQLRAIQRAAERSPMSVIPSVNLRVLVAGSKCATSLSVSWMVAKA